MCPSYRVTREEEHSTRGRSRLLMEMVRGEVITRRLALHRGARRARPVPGLQGLPQGLPGRAWTWPPTRRSSSRTTTRAGCGPRRTTRWAGCRCWPRCSGRCPAGPGQRGRPGAGARPADQGGRRNRPAAGPAALRQAAVHHAGTRRRRAGPSGRDGHPVAGHVHQQLPPRGRPGGRGRAGRTPDSRWRCRPQPLCCGLTWISTGQLGMAERDAHGARSGRCGPQLRAGHAGGGARAELRGGVPVRRGRTARLRRRPAAGQADQDARRGAHRGGLAPGGLLEASAGRHRRRPPPAIAQVHCHQHAIMGFDPDTEICAAAASTSRCWTAGAAY